LTRASVPARLISSRPGSADQVVERTMDKKAKTPKKPKQAKSKDAKKA
jgi:hypothetical protein